MTNKEFDAALQHIVTEESLPFDEQHWSLLQSRMDKKERSKKSFLLLQPITAKQWAAAACIAITLAGGLSYLYIGHDTVPHAVSIQPPTPGNNNNSTTLQSTNDTGNSTRAPIPVIATAIVSHPKVKQQNDAHTTASQTGIKEGQLTTQIDPGKHAPGAAMPQPRKKQPIYPPVIFNEFQPVHTHKMSVALNGGITLQNGNGVAASITVRNRISSKVSLETSIGFIQGHQDVQVKNQRVKEPEIGSTDTSHMQPIVETWYVQHKNNLPYLQLSPALNLKLHAKLNSSIGVDIQKILMDQATLSALNEKLATTAAKKIPGIDPGLVLNVNYALTKRIGCGISYRESMINLGSEGKQYINRDYFTVQLQYTIVK